MVAFDAHKATIAVAVCEEDGATPAFYGTIPNEAMSVRRLIDKVGAKGIELEVAYEAGPTGFTLYRQLTRMGVRCSVVAPSLIPRRSGDLTAICNSHLRHVLVESAHHARHAPNANGAAKQRQAGVPADIVDMAWKAQERLHRRYRNLSPRWPTIRCTRRHESSGGVARSRGWHSPRASSRAPMR